MRLNIMVEKHLYKLLVFLVVAALWIAGCSPSPDQPPAAPLPALVVPTLDPTASPFPPTVSTPSPFPTTVDTETPTQAASPTDQPTTGPVAGSQDDSVRFAVIGDFGLAGPAAGAVADLVKSWQPDLILTTGDNNYPSGGADTIDENIGQYYGEFIAPYRGAYGTGAGSNRFFPVLGNHDLDTEDGRAYLEYFSLPGNERYYDFVWGPVHFYALNSDWREPDGIGSSSAQAAWLQQGLESSQSPWKIVYLHAAPYSSGRQASTTALRWPFKEWGAHAVIAGHDHTYERLEIGGLPYFVNGLGGGPRYEFVEILPESLVRYRDDFGAMLVEATAQRISYRFINIRGDTIDSIELNLTDFEQQAQSAPATPTAAPAQQGQADRLPDVSGYGWQPVASGLTRPVGLTPANDGSGRLFIVEQPGVIRVLLGGALLAEPFLDIRERVGSVGNEQGLLGLAFHPRYADNRFFYVNYTDLNGDTVVSRFKVTRNPNRADPFSEKVLLSVDQPYANHNGGHLLFGPDGYLYIGLGDGGSGGDPQGNAQSLQTLLGKILRIDVDGGNPYGIPADNPFAEQDGLPEIWALGLRNPWRYSFDELNGDLYIADVGQNRWEEVNYLPAGSPAGVNFGWDYYEGSHVYEGTPPEDLDLIDPVAEYEHVQGRCSVSGGIVYRGDKFPQWRGVYMYADLCSSTVYGLLRDPDGGWQQGPIFEATGLGITAFAQDQVGDLYVTDLYAGMLYRLAQE